MPLPSSGGKCSRCFDEHKCTNCPELTFVNSVRLIEHLRKDTKHTTGQNSVFRCSICGNKTFPSKEAYIHHLEQKLIHTYDLHQAACCGQFEDVDRLIRCENINVTGISHKVNPNSKITHHTGSTPLHCAAFHGYSRCLKIMLSWPESNPNVPDESDGRTPVHVAAVCGRASSLKELLKKGGSLDVKDNHGKTPLELVSSLELARCLPCVFVIVHFLRHCLQAPASEDDHPNATIDQLVKWLVGFINQLPSHDTTIGHAQENTELQIVEAVHPVHSTDLLPYEVLARGEKCIEAFKKAMSEGKAPAWRMKLLVLGEVGAGKTSLTRSLSGEPFQETREKTHGIDTSSVSEMMDNTELNSSWKLADPEDSHVDQLIAQLLSHHLDLSEIPNIRKLLGLPDSTEGLVPGLPQSPRLSSDDNQIVQSPTIELDQYPGLSTPSKTPARRSRVLVTEEKFSVPGALRKLPASLVARELSQKGRATSDSVKVNIWDFAGHQLYETMHHVFLNNRSLYLVVFSLLKMTQSEEKCLATIQYWLNSIAVHTSNSTPIFLVGTRKDAVDENQVKHINELLVAHFENSFGTRLVRKSKDEYVFAVENSLSQEDEGMSCLITAIMKEAMTLPFVSEELPIKWLHFEEEILTYQRDPKLENCLLTIEELRNLFSKKCDVQFTDEDFRQMLNFFHDCGLIILPDHMCKNCTKSIKELVVLSPQYLVDIMTHIHDAPERLALNRQLSQELKKLKKEGKACPQLLEHVWDQLDSPPEVLVEVLAHFNLMHSLCTEKEQGDEANVCEPGSPDEVSSPSRSLFSRSEYIIPCLLKGKPGEAFIKQWEKICQEQPECGRERVFVFDFGRFLPPALFHYLLVGLCRRSQTMKGMEPILRSSGGIFSLSNVFMVRVDLVLKDCQIWIYSRCKKGFGFLQLVAILVDEVYDICQQHFKFLKFVYGPECPRKNCPGACADVKAVQRPSDSGSSDNQESSDEETVKGEKSDNTSCNTSCASENQTGRRAHVIPMNPYAPPYWCLQVEIDKECLKDWRPEVPSEFNESFDEVDTVVESSNDVDNNGNAASH